MFCVDPCATREQTSESTYQFLFKLPTFAAEQPGPLRKSRRFEQECRCRTTPCVVLSFVCAKALRVGPR